MKISELGQLVSSEIIWVKTGAGERRYKIGVFQADKFRAAYSCKGTKGWKIYKEYGSQDNAIDGLKELVEELKRR